MLIWESPGLNFPIFPLHRHNRVIFEHLLQAKALSYLQIDSCRLGSVNESLSVLLMAKKFQRKALQNAAAMKKSLSPSFKAVWVVSSAVMLVISELKLACTAVIFIFSCHAPKGFGCLGVALSSLGWIWGPLSISPALDNVWSYPSVWNAWKQVSYIKNSSKNWLWW